MDNLKLINFRALSKELTGSESTIRRNNISGKKEPIFKELNDLLEFWIKRYNKDPYQAPNRPRNLKGNAANLIPFKKANR